MGGGILPVAIKNNQLYFLLGKENDMADTPGWADFGGGNENNETNYQAAIREGVEELNGFLGSVNKMKIMVRNNKIIHLKNKRKTYESILFLTKYNEDLVYYFNNNYRFLIKHLPNVKKQHNGLLEKSEIKWFSISDLQREKKYRIFYKEFVYMILKHLPEIKNKIRQL
jgi:8-oxo-dGTP pyrophosphatase MutT (NUDIX family)